jgi:hypothetical protein
VADPSTPTGAASSSTTTEAATTCTTTMTEPASGALSPRALQLQKDAQEAREMLALATSGGKAHAALTQLLASVERELAAVVAAPSAAAAGAAAADAAAPVASSQQPAAVGAGGGGDEKKYEAIDSFGWDQASGGCLVGWLGGWVVGWLRDWGES